MRSCTHLLLSVAATSLTLGTANPIQLILSAVSSQIPDVDTTHSVPGRLLFPISRYLENRFPHRSVTHSFMGLAIFGAITFPTALIGRHYWLGLVSGYFWGFFGDVFTKSGVALFYPSQVRAVCPGNPRLRLSTGSKAEFFVLTLLSLLAIASININSTGGILRTFNSLLGIPAGAVEIARAEASQYLLRAQVLGQFAITQQPVDAAFEVVRPLTQADLLLKDTQGRLFRVGTTQECQIIASRILIERGERISLKAQQLQLEDQSVTEVLASSYPERTYINGTLTLEDAGDLILPTHSDRFDPITLQPGKEFAIVRLESASPTLVATLLGDYYANGSLIIRSLEVQQ